MTIDFARAYRLVPRGAAGLACDDDGVALGPVRLVEAVVDPSGRRTYRMRPAAEVAEALRLAYGATADAIENARRGLAEIARLLNSGERAQAGIRAVQLAFPEIASAAMAKLTHAASLQKDNPNWADEPRNPAGDPTGGEWTNGGGGQADANVHPATAPLNPVQAMKERFVDAHLADTQKAADQLGIPVENILGLSALESRWGTSRIATQANNFFGINYPAPHADGRLTALKPGPDFSKFASYADSLKSFVAISGSLIRGKSDPVAFATALQNSGKFGIDPDTGAKVPSYVPDVAGTIRGLRAIVARSRI
ncbi:MAG: glucosaminidase domain-containing protein [Stellaceae bacterium]